MHFTHVMDMNLGEPEGQRAVDYNGLSNGPRINVLPESQECDLFGNGITADIINWFR